MRVHAGMGEITYYGPWPPALRQPAGSVTEFLAGPVHPDQQQSLNYAPNRPPRWDEQETRGHLLLHKFREVPRHCAYVSRDRHTTGLRGEPKNVRIRSAIRDEPSSSTKID